MTWSIIPTPYGSVSLNGSTQYITYSVGQNLAVSSSTPFTIEFWLYPLTQVQLANAPAVYSTDDQGITTGHMAFFVGHSAFSIPNQYGLYWVGMTSGTGGSGTQTNVLTSTVNYTKNAWTHIAIVRVGTSAVTMYINGVANATTTYTGLVQFATNTLHVGTSADAVTNSAFTGYISNFRWVNSVAVYTGNFTPPTAPLFGTQSAGTNISALTGTQTSILLNTPNNASFLADSSANNFTPTNVGSATANSLTPFNAAANTAWSVTYNPFGSVSFNGSTQYLTTATNAAFSFGTGDYTVEFWIYLNALPGSKYTIMDFRLVNGSTPHTVFVSSTGYLGYYNGTSDVTSTSLPISTGAWYHIAYSRISGTLSIYVAGSPAYSAANSINYGASNKLTIGASVGQQAGEFVNGYMSNIRIVKGVGVYTGPFNVPKSPLLGIQPTGTTNIVAITGTQTSLLLNTPNDANFLVDSSANQFTVTNNGTATANSLTPFVTGGGSGWSYLGPANGSASFNGTSQYLTTPVSATAFNYAAGGMTWEAWLNTDGNYTNDQTVFSKRPAGPTTPSQIEYRGFLAVTTGYVSFATSTSGGVVTTYASSIKLTPNTWSHVAWVIDSTPNVNIYINGTSVYSAALTPAPTTNSEPVVVGGQRGFSGYFSGYISNFRMVKGVAVYTSNFTPPIRQIPATQQANVYGVPSTAITSTQTSLLLNTPNNSQNIQDSSTNNFTITNTGTVTPSGINPFVPDLGAVRFNGSSQYLTVPSNSAFAYGTGDFSVECWVYKTSSADGSVLDMFAGAGVAGTFGFYITSTTIVASQTNLQAFTFTYTLSLNSWKHIAFSRISGSLYCFVNGVSVGSPQACTNNFVSVAALTIGRNPGGNNQYFTGYITNIRLTKGVAVYTGNFTPSTQPLPATQSANVYGSPSAAITGTQTSLLLNMPNNANFIKDSSTNGFTVTNNNTAVATSLTPFST